MEVIIAVFFVATATQIITGTFIMGVSRLIQHLFPWDYVPQWIETLGERFRQWS